MKNLDSAPLECANQFVIIVNNFAEQLVLVSSFSISCLLFLFFYGFFTAMVFAITKPV